MKRLIRKAVQTLQRFDYYLDLSDGANFGIIHEVGKDENDETYSLPNYLEVSSEDVDKIESVYQEDNSQEFWEIICRYDIKYNLNLENKLTEIFGLPEELLYKDVIDYYKEHGTLQGI